MNSLKDLEQRMSRSMKNMKLVFNIGDIIRITGLNRSQIHYWERKKYIHPVKNSGNGNHLYDHGTLIKISVMQSYLRSGFTLKTANQKASKGKYYGQIIGQMVVDCFHGIKESHGKIMLDFGTIGKAKDKELYFVLDPKHQEPIHKVIINQKDQKEEKL